MHIERTNNGLMVYDNSNRPYMPISIDSDMLGFNLSGDLLVVSYPNGRNEVYNVNSNTRVR
jgi:hypothetical protein